MTSADACVTIEREAEDHPQRLKLTVISNMDMRFGPCGGKANGVVVRRNSALLGAQWPPDSSSYAAALAGASSMSDAQFNPLNASEGR